jgi:hypothetical protein
MNYLEWNKKLYEYFFDNSNQVVYLSITRDKLSGIGGFTDKETAFDDFKEAVLNFPADTAGELLYPFLKKRVNYRNIAFPKPSSLLAKAINFKNAWGKYKYVPFQGAGEIESWPSSKEPPYIAYLTALVLSIDEIKDDGGGFWGDFECNFEKKGSNYGENLIDLFEDLKRYEPRFDYFSVYPKNIYEGTIYSQMPLTETELDSLRLFFVSKDISYDDLQNYSYEDLRRLLLDELDENFANKLTIDALHDNSSEYDNFRIALPGIVKKLITNYDLNDEKLQKELEKKITEKESNRKYPFLLCFPFSKDLDTYFPKFSSGTMMPLILNHGSKSDILDESETEITFKISDTEHKIKINPEGKFSRPTKPINLDWDKQYHITKKGLSLKDNKRKNDIIIFVPSHIVGSSPGYFIESPNETIPNNEPCIIYWNVNSDEAVLKFLDGCKAKTIYNDNFKIANWSGAFFKMPSDATIGKYIVDTEHKISLIGGVGTNPYGNEYFSFALPKLISKNLTSDTTIEIYKTDGDKKDKVDTKSAVEIETMDLNSLFSKGRNFLIVAKSNGQLSSCTFSILSDFTINHSDYKKLLHNEDESEPLLTVETPVFVKSGEVKKESIKGQIPPIYLNEKEFAPKEINFESIFENTKEYDPSHIGDRILTVLSHRKTFSKNQFLSIVYSFAELDTTSPFAILNKLIEYGHIQRLPDSKDKYEVVDKTLVHFLSEDNWMMLCGARSPERIQQLLYDLKGDNIECVLKMDQDYVPTIVLIKVKNLNIYKSTYQFTQLFFNRYIGKNLLNSIPNYKNLNLGNGLSLLNEESNATLEKFNPETFKFKKRNLNSANADNNLGLYRFDYKRSYKPKVYFLKKEGNFHRLESSDQQEALYLYQAQTAPEFLSWVYYDKVHKLLAIPVQLSLPQGAQKALVLSGCFSKVVTVKSENTGIYRPQITANKMQLSAEGETYMGVTVYTNIQDYIYEVLNAKLNKQFNLLDLSNLLQ